MISKKDYEEQLLKIINPTIPFFSEEKAYINFGNTSAEYREKAKGIEGFARPLWGLAPYYSCKNEDKEYSYSKYFRKGLESGTDPESKEYWGEISDFDQVMVEMAAIGFSLIVSPQEFFYKLSDKAKNNLAKWLYQINEHRACNNNWRLFSVIINCGLKNVKMPFSNVEIESALSEMDKWYIGDGWYYDGMPDRIDYYNAFAIHFYSLIYAKFIEKEDINRSKKYKKRAQQFANSYIHFFADSGEAIPFGRSLTYRFAQVAFWSALIWADCSPYSLEVIKGIINRNLNYWFNSNMTDNFGLLTIGYSYSNLLMSDNYNSPSSPYWALKSFLILALPIDHPFFKVIPKPLPLSKKVFPISKIGMTITHNDFDSVLYPHGLNFNYDCCLMAEKYSKFAYSAKFGFSIPRSEYSINMKSPDSMLVFDVCGINYVRYHIISYEYTDTSIKTIWSPCSGIFVETEIIPFSTYHKRIHRISSELECFAYDTGFAVPYLDDISNITINKNTSKIITNNFGCSITSINGTPAIINSSPNTNLVYPKTKIPTIRYKINKGTTKIHSTVYELFNK